MLATANTFCKPADGGGWRSLQGLWLRHPFTFIFDMKIIVDQNSDCQTFAGFFDFNNIDYQLLDLYDNANDKFGRNNLPLSITTESGSLLVIGCSTFYSMCAWSVSRQNLIDFCKKNKIWVWQEIDTLAHAIFNQKLLADVDTVIAPGSITLFFDGKLSEQHSLQNLKNITTLYIPFNFFLQAGRISNGDCKKQKCSKDFLLTMIKKSTAPHREILWKQLLAIDSLLDRGHVRYGSRNDTWLGQQTSQHRWQDGHPSMDLYRDSWLEIAPETLYRNGYFITEKTVKPIITKTPFMTVGTCGFLTYLKDFGFKTFDTLIDEKYDQAHLIEDRVKLMLQQLQDIIANGSESFYQASLPILEHNQSRLFEIVGGKQYETDRFIAEHLDLVEKSI